MSDTEKTLSATSSHGADQEIKPRGGRLAMALLLVVVVVMVIWAVRHQKGAAKPAAGAGGAGAFPVPVVAGKARQKDVPIYLDGLGTVQAFNTVTIRARVDGQLMKIAFTEGQDVKTGDLLAEIDPAPYQAVLDQAEAKKAQDETQLVNARLDLTRYADLLASESTTKQTYETQKALVSQLEAASKADQAAIDAAKVNLNYAIIRSPINGRVGIRLVDQGNIIHANDANGIVVLTQLKPISIVFTLPETALGKLQDNHGDTELSVLAVSRDNTDTLATGKLAVIDNQIDSTTGTLKLKANFDNEDLRLWPGQFVNTRLLLTTLSNSVVVPASVVQRGPDGAFVFVVQEDQTVKMRPIKVAQIDSGEALIESGLKVGESVVIDGQYKLQNGSHVNLVDSSTNSTGDMDGKARTKKP